MILNLTTAAGAVPARVDPRQAGRDRRLLRRPGGRGVRALAPVRAPDLVADLLQPPTPPQQLLDPLWAAAPATT
jgi:hypothetical protein